MFQKSLRIVKNGDTLLEIKIFPIFNKSDLFLKNDRLMLFGSPGLTADFSAPKRSQVFLDNYLIGNTGASGSLDIRSDQFTGLLHLLYIS